MFVILRAIVANWLIMTIGPSRVQSSLLSYEWLQNRPTAKQELNLSIRSMITEQIGRRESPVTNKSLPLKFPKMTNTFVGDNISVRALSQVRVPPFWKLPSFVGLVVVAMVIVINSGIGGFSWVDQVWLIRLQPIVCLHCPITTLQNDIWKIKQSMPQSHFRKL